MIIYSRHLRNTRIIYFSSDIFLAQKTGLSWSDSVEQLVWAIALLCINRISASGMPIMRLEDSL